MANEEQLAILKQGVQAWNLWRYKNFSDNVDLRGIGFRGAILRGANLRKADLREAAFVATDLTEAHLSGADLREANFSGAILTGANLMQANLEGAYLRKAKLIKADLNGAVLRGTNLVQADLIEANLVGANLSGAILLKSDFSRTRLGYTNFGNTNFSYTKGLEETFHRGPSTIGVDTIASSKGAVPESFLRGCGLSDADIEYAKLSKPDLSNDEISTILYKIYDLRARQSLQVSPLFISYSHADNKFVDKLEINLDKKGVRFWRDIHDLKAGRMEKQVDQAICQNPTVLLVLSQHSLNSDWVEHEVRKARDMEKEMGQDVLCPVALDDDWKDSRWPKRIMEQIMEYNILDFSAWEDESKFDGMFRKLIDGLELFYKG